MLESMMKVLGPFQARKFCYRLVFREEQSKLAP